MTRHWRLHQFSPRMSRIKRAQKKSSVTQTHAMDPTHYVGSIDLLPRQRLHSDCNVSGFCANQWISADIVVSQRFPCCTYSSCFVAVVFDFACILGGRSSPSSKQWPDQSLRILDTVTLLQWQYRSGSGSCSQSCIRLRFCNQSVVWVVSAWHRIRTGMTSVKRQSILPLTNAFVHSECVSQFGSEPSPPFYASVCFLSFYFSCLFCLFFPQTKR